ncbi:MAG TPA: hypothetical protein VMV53_01235 [Acidimicrobiales bacterium]|nr:hypothetical protein [Acidimicrobiales bacterium]
MKRDVYRSFALDVRRFRPVMVVALTLVTLVPSLYEMVADDLSPLAVLIRLAETFPLMGLMVWLVSGVALRYARIQARSDVSGVSGSEEA